MCGRAPLVLTHPTSLATEATLWGALGRVMARGVNAFVIGGSRLFSEALPLATHLDLTLIGREYEGDVKFPTDGFRHPVCDGQSTFFFYGAARFDCVERRPGTHPDLTFTKWERRT